MPISMRKKKYINLPFRKILKSSGLIFGLCLSAQAGLAGAGSGGERASEQLSKFLDSELYSQAEIVELNHKELTYLYNYRIDGFLDAMASNIVKMALSDRESTRQLLQDMAVASGEDARTDRLAAEVQRATETETKLAQSVKHLKAEQGTSALADEKRQLRRAGVYKRGVKSWLRYPREGTYKPPFSLSFDIKL
jgi:hypothetical protein